MAPGTKFNVGQPTTVAEVHNAIGQTRRPGPRVSPVDPCVARLRAQLPPQRALRVALGQQ